MTLTITWLTVLIVMLVPAANWLTEGWVPKAYRRLRARFPTLRWVVGYAALTIGVILAAWLRTLD